MQQRRVRFSSTNTVLSIPALVIDSAPSSPASSCGPPTPPPLPYTPSLSMRHSSHWETQHQMKSRANDLIALAAPPVLTYDISLHPTTISTHFHGLSSARLLKPAVYPPRPTISLVTPHLPWTLAIPPGTNAKYVTVLDVLTSIYLALRVNVTAKEFAALHTAEMMQRVTAAYTQRYRRLRSYDAEYALEKAEGVKRVDFLMGYTKFCGIAPTVGKPDVWEWKTA
ncbi:hypothetical protein MSAN_01946500 [Mycena sanguinolenta]|uniref:DUF6699 domain-containing protein n=1 Tax=Mycena sanguinolenta TaxID=230812 RepID=A0A8H6XL50_9AGAR|nr:hypothetical protein MSAN_01946500 [Mycena sanguinolenta]